MRRKVRKAYLPEEIRKIVDSVIGLTISLRWFYLKIAIALDPGQVVLNNELLMSQVSPSEAIIRLLVEKGYSLKRNS